VNDRKSSLALGGWKGGARHRKSIAGALNTTKSRRCAKPAALTIVIELKRSDGASCFGQTVANLPHFAINLPQKVSGMAL